MHRVEAKKVTGEGVAVGKRQEATECNYRCEPTKALAYSFSAAYPTRLP